MITFIFHSIVTSTYNIGNLFFYHRFPAIVICEGVVISAIGILGLVNSFKTMKVLIIAYYVLNILASIAAIILLFLSLNFIFIENVELVSLLFVNIFVKLPIPIIASIKAKTILNNMNRPLTHDIEMNDIANVDQTEQTTNKSE